MLQIQRARTTDESVDPVKQAVFEVDDLNACLEWNGDDDALAILRAMPRLEPLTAGMRVLQRSMVGGDCRSASGELPCMELLRHHPGSRSYAQLLERNNETHCHGLDVD